MALLTGSSPPEACEEHFRERILVLHQSIIQLIIQLISVINGLSVIHILSYFTFLREFDMFDVELVDNFSW